MHQVVKKGLIIVALLAAGACAPGTVGNPFDRATPHEKYARALDEAGLADTALAREWLNAAGRALSGAEPAKLPLTDEVEHDPSKPQAYGYRLDLRQGRVLRVALDVTATEPTRIFIDLFETRPDGQVPRHLASSEPDLHVLEYEVRTDGTYILRIQPELLRGGTLTIGQRTEAALTFPVSGRSTDAVRSFFLDPRDNATRDHHGIDIFAPRETPVLAAADGLVSRVGTNNLGGNVVWIWDSRRGQSHYYAHLERQAVATGTRVRAGDIIGYVGNSGNARTTPPHLHFGIYQRGAGPVDPLPFVQGARGPVVNVD